jgi:hypothetical protein
MQMEYQQVFHYWFKIQMEEIFHTFEKRTMRGNRDPHRH